VVALFPIGEDVALAVHRRLGFECSADGARVLARRPLRGRAAAQALGVAVLGVRTSDHHAVRAAPASVQPDPVLLTFES
jgi:hypothetical protein